MKVILEKEIVSMRCGATAGTYSLCTDCKRESNCCVEVSPNAGIDAPILFEDDVLRIEALSGMRRDQFSVIVHKSSNHRTMKSNNGGCVFCNNGTCAIYESRPVDCRLFPFDVMEKDDASLVWIAYTNICHKSYDARQLLAEVKPLLHDLGDNLLEYARTASTLLDTYTYVEVETIPWPNKSLE